MEKEERIDLISRKADDCIFLIVSRNMLYWKENDMGYTEDIAGARKFTKREIIDKLKSNGLIDKTIEVYSHAGYI